MDLPFDPDALREKYRRERDKRLRPDGNDQYREITGALAGYLDDPHVEPGFTRAALAEETEVAIIGGGFSGLLAAVRLVEAGIEDVRLIETGGDFGGTWYWNRYPGVQCDIESYIYLPLLEELGYVPKEKYSHGPEIWAHAQAIGRHYGLYEKALFQTQLVGMRWDEASARWILSTSREEPMCTIDLLDPFHRRKFAARIPWRVKERNRPGTNHGMRRDEVCGFQVAF